MDPSQTNGFNMAVVGISTVFFALALLVWVVGKMASLLSETPAPVANVPAAATAVPASAGKSATLRHVALAAFALHHHRNRTRAQTPITVLDTWRRVGRSEQASALERRG